jgi:hypothetical protein
MLMFLLSLLPMWVFQAVAAALVIVGFLIYALVRHPVVPSFIPRFIGMLFIASGIFVTGGLWTQREYLAEVEKFKQEVARIEKESQAATEKIVTQYKEKLVVVKEKGDVIIQKVPEYITKESDAKCDVPNGFVVLHDSASKNEIPNTTSSSNGEASGVALSTVATTVVGNYTTCHEVREQLKSLQDWVKNQEQIYNKN